VLRKYNIPDVECEIKEAEVFNLAGPRLLKLQLHDSCRRERLPFTRTLGQSIVGSNLAREGSMGFYVKQSDGNRHFGLTCRHCVLDTDNEAYSYTTRGQPALRIIQPGPKVLRSGMNYAKRSSSFGPVKGNTRRAGQRKFRRSPVKV